MKVSRSKLKLEYTLEASLKTNNQEKKAICPLCYVAQFLQTGALSSTLQLQPTQLGIKYLKYDCHDVNGYGNEDILIYILTYCSDATTG